MEEDIQNYSQTVMFPRTPSVYNKTFIHMLRIASKPAEPIGLKFFVDTHKCPPPVL